MTLSAAMSASSASTAMWSVFPFNLSPTVIAPARLLFPLLWGRHSSVSSPCVAKGRAQRLLRCECCQRLHRSCRTNTIRKRRKIKLEAIAACEWLGNLSAKRPTMPQRQCSRKIYAARAFRGRLPAGSLQNVAGGDVNETMDAVAVYRSRRHRRHRVLSINVRLGRPRPRN